ncbi:extracellular solute-binding protein [Arthrobacter oryzae]|uniref:extracellular solute-binding protein n=1 Tax=Arthrobacter oryzae TaxID=409290 RepID=UPI00273C72A6|nr:extracellular solute-binding protein [Arthrobacter oryzae]WLQ07716.1 extracellular solute-binding protein [Arthrobacter oryzae]
MKQVDSRPMQMTRRQLLLGGGVLAGSLSLGASLTGCGGAAQAAGNDIRFWHLLSGGDGIKMMAMIDKANADHPDFRIKPTVLAWGTPYYTKLAMASAGGRPPEVAVMHAARVPGYAPGGLLDAWDLDLLAEFGVRPEDFGSRIWEKSQFNGQVFSLALDSHPFVMLYNTEVADKAGVLGSDGRLADISSPSQFLEVSRELQRVTGKHGLSYGYLGDGAQMWRLFYTLYRQHGADFILEPGRPAQVDRDVAIDCLEFITSLLDNTISTKSGDGGTAIAEFASQGSGLLFTGVWELPTMKTAGVPFGASTIPTLFGTPAAFADSHSFVLPHQATLDESRRRGVYQFVASMLKNSLSWAEAGHIPAYQPVVNSPEYAALKPQADYAHAADIINYDPVAWFTGSGSDFQGYFAENVQNVFLGRDKAADGWDAFMKRINTVLAMPNPV